jgi:hypothetical protein
VADRFHLLQNTTDTLKRFFDHQPKILRAANPTNSPVVSNQTAATETDFDLVPDTVVPADPVLIEIGLSERAQRFAEVKVLQQ